jgi:hypothetical protein
MFRVRPGRTFADAHHLARTEIAEWNEIVEKVTDLFLRMNTQDAEVAASVKFAADRLRRERTDRPADSDAFRPGIPI